LGDTHGFDPVTQISPTDELPFKIPFTVQVTAPSGVFVTFAVSVTRWVTTTVAMGGETLTVTLLVIVTPAEAVAVPAVA
jgi:hypothetical protein